MQQGTIASAVEWRGTGLHGGTACRVRVSPADPETGLVFVVRDDEASIEIPARPESVVSTARATTLARPVSAAPGGSNGSVRAQVATVEHLLATLFVFGIDDARIEVEGGEIPVLDGSAAPFVEGLRAVGRRAQGGARRALAVREAFEVVEGDRWIRIEPAEEFELDYAIDFPHPSIGRQRFRLAGDLGEVFVRELAGARTFGFEHEVAKLRSLGLARGGDLSNTLVFGEAAIVNPDGLRWPDEPVRHKVVDLLGDLALLGGRLCARITAERAGHGLHHALVRALVERRGLSEARRPVRASGSRRAVVQPG